MGCNFFAEGVGTIFFERGNWKGITTKKKLFEFYVESPFKEKFNFPPGLIVELKKNFFFVLRGIKKNQLFTNFRIKKFKG